MDRVPFLRSASGIETADRGQRRRPELFLGERCHRVSLYAVSSLGYSDDHRSACPPRSGRVFRSTARTDGAGDVSSPAPGPPCGRVRSPLPVPPRAWRAARTGCSAPGPLSRMVPALGLPVEAFREIRVHRVVEEGDLPNVNQRRRGPTERQAESNEPTRPGDCKSAGQHQPHRPVARSRRAAGG